MGFDRKVGATPDRSLHEGRPMFGKKTNSEKGVVCQCPVPGCGLTCMGAESLKRHMDWAHAGNAAASKPGDTQNSPKTSA